MPIQELQGAWRLLECCGWNGNRHPYGDPNSHWLIVGEHGIPIETVPPSPFFFEFRLTLDELETPHSITLSGSHGGRGYFDLTDSLLIVTLGSGGVKPPRFDYGCGNYFAFEKDHHFAIPDAPKWPRNPIAHERLGSIVWNEANSEWLGAVELPDGNNCEIWAVDDLVPISVFLPQLELVHEWLCSNLANAKTECAEAVHEWTEEMPGYEHLAVAEIVDTITVDSISATNFQFHCWASTTIPIDHSIRLWIEIDGGTVRTTGTSIEG